MGISKSLWMAQTELAEINEDINMSDEDYFDKHLIERDVHTSQVLNQCKKDAEADVESLTALGVKAGLVKV